MTGAVPGGTKDSVYDRLEDALAWAETYREERDKLEAALRWIGTGKHDDFEATSDGEWALGMQHVANAALGKHPLAERFAARAAVARREGTQ